MTLADILQHRPRDEYADLLQSPRGMEGCDVISSRQHFEEGVPVLVKKKK